jgi:hypothetical protein
MASVPAICATCGLVFPSGIGIGKNAKDIVLFNNAAICPRCGSEAQIPSGIYNALSQTVVILLQSKRSARELQKLLDALNRAREQNASPQEIKKIVKQHAPDLKNIADWIPQTPSEAYAAIQAICSVIAILITLGIYRAQPNITPEMVDEIVQKAVSNIQQASSPTRTVEQEVIVVTTTEPKQAATTKATSKRKPKRRGRRTSGR